MKTNPYNRVCTLLLITLALFCHSLSGQTFPVRATVQVNGFSGQLETYDDPGRVLISLLNTDLRNPYEGLLRVSLSGPGFSITTKETFLGTPIILPRNQPVILSGPQLFDYFDPVNLDFNGLTLQQIQTAGGLLTEGPISLCVELVDAVRFLDAPVSNTACANGFLQLHRPPEIIEPAEIVSIVDPQLLRYLWQPQHAGVAVEYRLEVYEDVLPGLSPELVIGATQPLFVRQTMNTAHLQTNADPLLRPGAKYYVRVRARDIAGQAVFLNGGWSNIHSFIYGEEGEFAECNTTISPYLVGFSSAHALLSWELAEETNDDIVVRYSPAVIQNWDTLTIGNPFYFNLDQLGLPDEQVAEAGQLSSSLLYMAQLQQRCLDGSWSTWSDPVFFHRSCELTGTLRAEDVTDRSATIIGQNVSNAAFYQFEFRQPGEESWQPLDPSTTAEIGMQELQAETTYEVQMRYWCTEGAWSNYSTSYSFTTLAPCPIPEQIATDVLSAQDALLSWVNGEDVTATEIRYQLLSQGQSAWQAASSTGSSVELHNLNNGAIYQYQVRNDCGTHFSDWSAVNTFALQCGPPQDILVSQITETTAQLDAERLSQAATATIFEYRETGAARWQTIAEGSHAAALSNLQALSYYDVRAKSSCLGGLESDYSQTVQFQTSIECLPPTGLVISNIEGSNATLAWDDESGVIEWEVQYRRKLPTDNSGQFSVTNTGNSGNSNTPPTTAVNGGNIPLGGTTNGSGETPPNTGEGTNEGTSETGGNAGPNSGEGNGPESEGVGGNQSEVELLFGDTAWVIVTTTNPGRIIGNLNENTAYEVKVRAKCPVIGWTPFSPPRRFRTAIDCDPPTYVHVGNISENTAKVNITPSGPNTGSYLVKIRSTSPIILIPGSSNWNPPAGYIPDPSSTPQTTANGPVLDGGGDGQSPVGNTATNQNWTSGPNFPGPGNNNSGGSNGTFPGGIDTTRMISSTVGDSIGIYMDSILTTQLHVTFTGLLPDTEYEVSVKAYCSDYGWTETTNWVIFRTELCLTPELIAEEIIDRSSARISWRQANGINNYEFKYRLADSPGANWVTEYTGASTILLENLLSDATYEYTVAEVCAGTGQLRSSPLDSFQLGRPSINNGFYVCGINTEVDLSNQVPLPQLKVDDVITAFDFPVLVTMADGANGYFTGTGEIQLPYFNKAKFAFAFDSVFINDDYRLVNGYLGGTGFGIEVLPPWVDSLLADILDALELVEEGLSGQIVEILEDILALGENSHLPPALVNDTQALIDCMTAAANAQERDQCLLNADSLIQDLEDHLEELFAADYRVSFAANANQQYGFDGKGSQEPSDWYTVRTIGGSDYYLPYKSVRAGYIEKVDALIPNGREGETTFSQPSGSPLPTEPGSGRRVSITFQGQAGNDYYLVAEQEVPDTTNHIAGLLEVVPYPELDLSVTLVPLSASAASNLQPTTVENDLTDILAQAVIDPDVALAPTFNPIGYDGQLDAVSSGLLSAYTGEMNTIIDAYTQQHSPDEEDYYLFLVDNYEQTDRAGYMPRGRNFGFLYTGNAGTGATLARTLAHELGHGAYVLEHTFDAHPTALPEGSTDNLMDYPSVTNGGGGTDLYKWQWDLMHDPVNAPLFPGDGSGSSVTVPMDSFLLFANADSTFTFLSPAGMPLTLPKNTLSVTFFTGEAIGGDDASRTCGGPGRQDFKIMPFGTLKSFKIQHYNTNGNPTIEEEFTACYACGSELFWGYASDFGQATREQNCANNNVFRDTLSRALFPNKQGNAILAFPCMSGEQIVMKIGKIPYEAPAEVAINNNGRGTFLEFNGLTSYYGNGGFSYQQNPSFDPPINGTYGAQFLRRVSSHAGCGDETALYVFAHLHQLNEHPEFFKYCGVDLVLDTEAEADYLMGVAQWWYSFWQTVSAPTPAGSSHVSVSAYESYAETPPPPSYSEKELIAWQNANMSIYDRLDELDLTVWSEEYFAALDENDEDDRQRLYDDLKVYKDYPCVYVDLTIENRLKCLRMLKHLDDFDNMEWKTNVLLNYRPNSSLPKAFFQRGNNVEHEHMYNVLLKTTPIEDYSAILDFYTGENGEFEEFYDVVRRMQDDELAIDDEGYGEFSTIITYMILNTYGMPGYTMHTNSNGIFIDIDGQSNSNEISPIGGYFPGFEFGLESSCAGLYNSTIGNDEIKLKGRVPCILGNPLSALAAFKRTDFEISSGNPFEFVALTVDSSFQMKYAVGDWEFKVNDDRVILVPYVWAAYIFERYNEQLQVFTERVIKDILAIVAAIPSGGTSLTVLAAAKITYAAGDIAFAVDAFNYQVTDESFLPQGVHAAWRLTGAAISLASAVGKTGLIKTKVGGIVQHIRINRLRGTIKLILRDGKDIYKGVSGLISSVKKTYNALDALTEPETAHIDDWWRYIDNFERELRDAQLFARKVDYGRDPDFNSLRLALILNQDSTYNEDNYQVFFKQGSILVSEVGQMSRDEELVFEPYNWLGASNHTPSNSTTIVATYDSLAYISSNGVRKLGTLHVHYDALNNRVFISEANPLQDFPSLGDLVALFTEKNWNWSLVDYRFGGFYEHLLEAQRIDVQNALRSFESGSVGQDKFVRLQDDLTKAVFGEYVKDDTSFLDLWVLLDQHSMTDNNLCLDKIKKWKSQGVNGTYANYATGIGITSQNRFAWFDNQNITYDFSGYGGPIVSSLDRTITLIGESADLSGLSAPNDCIVWEGYDHPGGLNRLTDDQHVDPEYWEYYLEFATQRGDVIRLISDPNNPQTIWANGIPPGQAGHIGVKTRTGQDIDYLEQDLNYHLDPTTNTYIPNNNN